MANRRINSFATTASAEVFLHKDGSATFEITNPDGTSASFIIDKAEMEQIIAEYRKYNPQASTQISEGRMAKIGDRVCYWTPDTGPAGKMGTIRFVEPLERWPDASYAQIMPDDGTPPLTLYDGAVWGFDVISTPAQQLDLFAGSAVQDA